MVTGEISINDIPNGEEIVRALVSVGFKNIDFKIIKEIPIPT